MKEIVIFMLVLAVVLAHGGNKPRRYYNKFVNDDMIDDLKKKNVTWQVMDPDENPLRKFSDDQMASVLSMIGGDIEKHDKKMHNQLEAGRRFNSIRSSDRNLKSSVNESLKSALPVSFDWRTSDIAKRCKPNVLAQESCGACYAFATAQVFAARYCSVTSGNVVDFSPQDILACNSRTNACNGGILDIAANYLEEYGVASLACIPYKEQNTPDTSNTPSQKCSTTCTVSGVTMEKKFCKKGTTIMLYGIPWLADAVVRGRGACRQAPCRAHEHHAVCLWGCAHSSDRADSRQPISGANGCDARADFVCAARIAACTLNA